MRDKKIKKEKSTHSMATVTPLVMNIFNSMFQDQIDGDKNNKERKRRCGICEVMKLIASYFCCTNLDSNL